MKFTQVIKNQTINFRLCDELTCKQIAMHVLELTSGASEVR